MTIDFPMMCLFFKFTFDFIDNYIYYTEYNFDVYLHNRMVKSGCFPFHYFIQLSFLQL